MTQLKEQKKARFTATIISLMVAVIFGVIATFIAHSQTNIEKNVLKILFSVGVGATTLFYAITLSFVVISIVFKYPLGYLFASGAFILGTLLLLILCKVSAWIIAIITVALILVAFLSFFLAYRNKLVLVADNEKPDYKDYKTRVQESANQPVKEEELPEIKSFKE